MSTKALRLATWNVNSLNVRLPHVLGWLEANPVDCLCLQETKLPDERFPAAALAEAGYRSIFHGQPTYNGVALLWRADAAIDPDDIARGNPLFPEDHRRVIAATLGDLRVICIYVPNGQSVGSDKYQYKLRWLAALNQWLAQQIERYPRLALLGDYNIAPDDRDVHDPAAWAGQVLCSAPEREQFAAMTSLGLKDCFRLFEQPPKIFSWWDYRQLAFRRNTGLRIDHILVTDSLAKRAVACTIDKAPRKLEQPSDHAPVVLEIDGTPAAQS
jgi:exodeoxyribonuclease III